MEQQSLNTTMALNVCCRHLIEPDTFWKSGLIEGVYNTRKSPKLTLYSNLSKQSETQVTGHVGLQVSF